MTVPILDSLFKENKDYTIAENGCWIWLRHIDKNGYSKVTLKINGKNVTKAAHQFSYEEKYGVVPLGLELDHFKCSNRKCINPDHVIPKTHKENTLRSSGPTAINANKTHCVHGHEFTAENTYYERTGRKCKTCRRENSRRSKAKKNRQIAELLISRMAALKAEQESRLCDSLIGEPSSTI